MFHFSAFPRISVGAVHALLLGLCATAHGAVIAPANAAFDANNAPRYASTHIIVKFSPETFPEQAGQAAAKMIGAVRAMPLLGPACRTMCERWGVTGVHPTHAAAFGDVAVAEALGLDRTFVLEVPEGTDTARMAAALSRFAEIEYAEVDAIGGVALAPNDEFFDLQWGMDNTGQNVNGAIGTVDADIDAPEAWAIHTGDLGTVTIAIIDSGVNPHPEFADRMVPGTNTATPGGPTTDDCVLGTIHHGTHVTGIAAASGNNTDGVAGVTWGALIMPVRVLGTVDPCSGTMSWAAAGIIWAVDNGADICNMSLQYYSDTGLQALSDAVDYAAAQGVLVVAASGNFPASGIAYPALFPGTVAVGATNSRDFRAGFSSYGDALDLTAPGVDILSTAGTSGYGFLPGTSMAAPHVSGLAALIKSYVPELTDVAIRNILTSSADDLGTNGWDNLYGYGRINADRALQTADKAIWIVSSTPPDGAIDARQPSEPNGVNPDGWERLNLTFSGDVGSLTSDDFSITSEGSTNVAPQVFEVIQIGPQEVTVVFDGSIPVGAWTTVRHDFSGTKIRVGYLPADANGDGTSAPADILALIDALNGVTPLEFWQSDVDRSGVTGPPDILRLIDLLNGAGVYDVWMNVTLP